MHTRVGLNVCFVHAKLNSRTCMIVGWNHTLAVLKLITALLCGLKISACQNSTLTPHPQTTHACVPHPKTSHDQHNTAGLRADRSLECNMQTWSNNAKKAHACAHGRPDGWPGGPPESLQRGRTRAARHIKTSESNESRGFKDHISSWRHTVVGAANKMLRRRAQRNQHHSHLHALQNSREARPMHERTQQYNPRSLTHSKSFKGTSET